MNLNKIQNFTVTRSHTQKKNLGNYESMDFFASYTAIVSPDATLEELQEISDFIAEKAENDVEMKIDPSRFISRQATLAEYRAKQRKMQEEIDGLKNKVKQLEYLEKPFEIESRETDYIKDHLINQG